MPKKRAGDREGVILSNSAPSLKTAITKAEGNDGDVGRGSDSDGKNLPINLNKDRDAEKGRRTDVKFEQVSPRSTLVYKDGRYKRYKNKTG